MKVTFRVLAALAVFVAALVLGWDPASPAGSKRGSSSLTSAKSSRSEVRRHTSIASHVRAAHHASSSKGVSIDDDDEYDDDDVVESGILTPDRRESDNNATARESAPPSTYVRPMTTVSSMHLRRRGIRPSGEHRDTTDRPPRA